MLSDSQVNCETTNLLLEDFDTESGTEIAFVKEVFQWLLGLKITFWPESSKANQENSQETGQVLGIL